MWTSWVPSHRLRLSWASSSCTELGCKAERMPGWLPERGLIPESLLLGLGILTLPVGLRRKGPQCSALSWHPRGCYLTQGSLRTGTAPPAQSFSGSGSDNKAVPGLPGSPFLPFSEYCLEMHKVKCVEF